MAEEGESEEHRVSEEAKLYGLEDRTFAFAKNTRAFIRALPTTLCNREDARQLVRSSGSVGANYLEAAESVGTKDYVFRLRISRKEAKESHYWLRLLYIADEPLDSQRQALVQEARELVLILNSLVNRSRK